MLDTKGEISRYSKIDGVDLVNRKSITPYIFGEEILFGPNDKIKYRHYQNGYPSMITSDHIIMGRSTFFNEEARTYVELGCGGGSGLEAIAKEHPDKKFIGIDRGLGTEVPKTAVGLPNVEIRTGDWNNTDLPPNSVDRIFSSYGVFFYGGKQAALEINRIAKKGTIIRGNTGDPTFNPNEKDRANIAQELSKLDWNVYVVNEDQGGFLVGIKN